MAKKILVVVDAQNDFITGVLGNKAVSYTHLNGRKLLSKYDVDAVVSYDGK